MKGDNMMSPAHKANDSKDDAYRKNYEDIFGKTKKKKFRRPNN